MLKKVVETETKEEIQQILYESDVVRTEQVGDVRENIDEIVASLSEKERTEVVSVVKDAHYEKEILEELYRKTKDKSVLTLMLQQQIADFQFDEAMKTIDENRDIVPQYLSWKDYLFVYANSSSLNVQKEQSIGSLKELVEELYGEGHISADDLSFYQSLISFWYGDIEAMAVSLAEMQTREYSDFVSAVEKDRQYASSHDYVPSYYTNALLALTLMQYRYTKIAQKVALDVIKEDDTYILPYQILAYSNFLEQERKKSSSYIRELLARDSKQRSMYQFLLGVISYREGKYQEAILYFVGVDEYYLLPDMYRYLILSYHEIGDTVNVVANFEKLLGERLSPSDYYTFFLIAYYEPIRYGLPFSIISQNPQIAQGYIDHCQKYIDESYQMICDIGQAGQWLQQKKTEKAYGKLLQLASVYPQPYIFKALGDYYYQTQSAEKAVKYYIRSMQLSQDIQERFHTKSQILKLYRDDENAKGGNNAVKE